jgi:hypothetical protein
MNDLIDLIRLTLPALLVFATAYYFFNMLTSRVYNELNNQTQHPSYQALLALVKEFHTKSERDRIAELKSENQKITLPLRLQAYERCILFLERIAPSAILIRMAAPSMNIQQLQSTLLATVRTEFEHNLSQQVYISSEAWEKLKIAKEEILKYINTATSGINDSNNASQYAANLLDLENQNPYSAHSEAIRFIAAEAREVLG